MTIQLHEEPIANALEKHAQIPIAFQVDRMLDVSLSNNGLDGIQLTERHVGTPYIKDYDAIKGEGPTRWAKRFDVSNWGLISAHIDDRRVGGVVIAWDTENVNMLEGRRDLAVVWDLRVTPDFRGQGVGSKLFKASEAWAGKRGCTLLKVETQNINVAACRFYVAQGCILGAINRYAYDDFPDEAQLLWYKRLAPDPQE